jgi:DNA polymerase family A
MTHTEDQPGLFAIHTLNNVASWLADTYADSISKLLNMTVPTVTHLPHYEGKWVNLCDGSEVPYLDGFVGYCDLETTGLSYRDLVTCAVAIGEMGGKQSVWVIAHADGMPKVDIRNSTVANWNQPFDRSYYLITNGKDTNTHIDLMGLSLAVRGTPEEWFRKPHGETWEPYCVPNNTLAAAYRFHTGKYLDKGVRDEIIKGTARIEAIVDYCIRDVSATVQVGRIVLKEYLACAPNPISLYGHIKRHSLVLPLSDRFEGYYERAEGWYQQQKSYEKEVIMDRLVASLYQDEPTFQCLHAQFPDKYQPRYFTGWQKVFMGKRIRYSDSKPRKKGVGCQAGNSLIIMLLPLLVATSVPYLVSLFTPKYFWEVYNKPLKARSAIIPLLLGLQYKGSLITYDRSVRSWQVNGEVLKSPSDNRKNLSTPLCKDYLKLFKEPEDGVGQPTITCDHLPAEFRQSLLSTVTWQMFRKRIQEIDSTGDGWYVPRYSPTGTLSGRAIDKLLLLISKPKHHMGGSEFFSMIEAKPGYRIVQADLDSGELVIAGWISCAYSGNHREDGTAFARANLEGNKDDSTDLHSIVASQVGINRMQSKGLNYGALYGQGIAARIEAIANLRGLGREDAVQVELRFREALITGVAKDYFEGIAMMAELRLPSMLLGRVMPQAYLHADGREGVTSIRNHCVQTLGVDWLDCLLAYIDYYLKQCGVNSIQFIMARHDEIAYHCPEELADWFTQVMQQAHRIVKWALLQQFRITEAHLDWLEFSAVDVNPRYLKDPDANPSTVTTQF